MAETLLFNIPTPASYQDTPEKVNWYQSDNGVTFTTRVDQIYISALVIDPSSGKYIWTSPFADPLKYHQLKTVSINGIESPSGFILPPRPQEITDTDAAAFYTEKIINGVQKYSIGETIEFMLEVDDEASEIIGSAINVLIIDPFGNIIESITASKIGSLYVANWKIPKLLSRLYNPNGETDNLSEYKLFDKWMMPSNTSVEFEFSVSKLPIEQPITDNSAINIYIDGIEALDSSYSFEKQEVKFLTHLTPFFASVEDIRAQNKELLESFNNFEIANEIIEQSKNVEYTLKPDRIYRESIFNYAVSQYVTAETALSLINAGSFNTTSETKELDTFKISFTKNEKRSVTEGLRDTSKQYELIILAGGLDTPFRTKTFVKGIFDPNRTNIGRLSIDNGSFTPYTNKTTKSFPIVNIDGSTSEVRGTHTVGYTGWSRYD